MHAKLNQSGDYAIDCSVPQGSVLGQLKFISYTEDSADLIISYRLRYPLYADDTQLIGFTKICNVPSTIDRLQRSVSSTRDWCASRRLQLYPSETELIWFGSCASLRNIAEWAQAASMLQWSGRLTPLLITAPLVSYAKRNIKPRTLRFLLRASFFTCSISAT